MDEFMKRALELAQKADPFPNPAVGAVLVKNNEIVGEGYHKKPGEPHAEIEAIEDAKNKTKDPEIAKGATLYVTLEPCSHTAKRTPPCTRRLVEEGIAKVVIAMKDPNPLTNGTEELRQHSIEVIGPTDEEEARKINSRYLENIIKKPFVAIKMAMSADGKTATKTGDSKWISGEESRKLVHSIRGEFDAIMVGAGTVIIDDPQLTTHIEGARDPYRVVVDGNLNISPDARIFSLKDGKTIVAASESAPEEKKTNFENLIICGKEDVDMNTLLHALGSRGIKKILIEGGSELNASAIKAGIVNKLYLFVAPKIIGGTEAKGVVGGEGIERMAEAIPLKNMECRRIGEDMLLEFDL